MNMVFVMCFHHLWKFPGHFQNISGKFPRNFQDMSGTFPGNFCQISRNFPRDCLGNVQDIPGESPGNFLTPYPYGISQLLVYLLFEFGHILTRFGQMFTRLWPDFDQIWARFFKRNAVFSPTGTEKIQCAVLQGRRTTVLQYYWDGKLQCTVLLDY